MSKMKKLVSVLLALVMVLAMTSTAFAVEGETPTTYSITITSEKTGHIYEAYQVFTGDLYDGVLSNVVWGSGVEGEDLLAALKADTTVVGQTDDDPALDITVASLFSACTTAADVAKVLSDNNTNSTLSTTFAQLASENLISTVAETSTEAEEKNSNGEYVYTISGLTAGYYLVKNQDNSVTADGDAYTDIILEVVKNVEIDEKATYPTLDKEIVVTPATDGNDEVTSDTNTASIGDTVTFKLTSEVPDMSAYTKYYFVVTDTLSAGLKYTENSMIITVGDKTLAEDTDYELTVKENTDGTTTLTIVFKNFIQYTQGAAITITYDAVVDDDAVIGVEGNDNTAKLTYSNNPNVDEGEDDDDDNPDTPAPDAPTGETPEAITTTYVTGIKVIKVDEDGNALTGAEFTLTGESVNRVKVSTDSFTADAEGTYYKLKDGTYTTEAPITDGGDNDNSEAYDSVTTTYSKTTTVSYNEETVKVSAAATVGDDGVLLFEGLGEGTYTLSETVVPDGYNKAANVTIEISCKMTEAGEDCTWTVTEPGELSANGGNIVEVTIENLSGSTLPSTGGMGTTIFYIVGSILVLGAAVLLITRKRMGRAE
ncbi:MAG: isopeptide-forming domain-containing fimbrial protein [Lachnospiraceae bacterium]|nr:isopeptide-forming domain-containing fimbrial protein [Lachnospiraceae bacterium]